MISCTHAILLKPATGWQHRSDDLASSSTPFPDNSGGAVLSIVERCSHCVAAIIMSRMANRTGRAQHRRPGLQASHEMGHDDDCRDLHRPLHADDKKEIAHHPADLGKVGIGPAQLDANPQVGRQQVAGALDRHQNDQSERRRDPTELRPGDIEKAQILGEKPAGGSGG
jgi:hypothetical protein